VGLPADGLDSLLCYSLELYNLVEMNSVVRNSLLRKSCLASLLSGNEGAPGPLLKNTNCSVSSYSLIDMQLRLVYEVVGIHQEFLGPKDLQIPTLNFSNSQLLPHSEVKPPELLYFLDTPNDQNLLCLLLSLGEVVLLVQLSKVLLLHVKHRVHHRKPRRLGRSRDVVARGQDFRLALLLLGVVQQLILGRPH